MNVFSVTIVHQMDTPAVLSQFDSCMAPSEFARGTIPQAHRPFLQPPQQAQLQAHVRDRYLAVSHLSNTPGFI